jgi:hypothetical protein
LHRVRSPKFNYSGRAGGGLLIAHGSIVQIFLPGLPNALLRFGAGQPMLAPISERTMMLHKPGVTQSLALLIAATRWDDIPAPVRHQAKRSIMNFR